ARRGRGPNRGPRAEGRGALGADPALAHRPALALAWRVGGGGWLLPHGRGDRGGGLRGGDLPRDLGSDHDGRPRGGKPGESGARPGAGGSPWRPPGPRPRGRGRDDRVARSKGRFRGGLVSRSPFPRALAGGEGLRGRGRRFLDGEPPAGGPVLGDAHPRDARVHHAGRKGARGCGEPGRGRDRQVRGAASAASRQGARTMNAFEKVERAIAEIRAGRMVILVDDEDRENEGDLCMAAELVTPEAIAFMAREARGLICLALEEEKIRQLNLPMMVADNQSPFETAFTVSIEAAHGVTTGI